MVKFVGRSKKTWPVVVAFVGILGGSSGCSRDADTPDSSPPDASVPVPQDATLRDAMLDEEDARGTGPSGIESLRQGLVSQDPAVQLLAVRGIGRLEDPELIPMTLPLLFSEDEALRAEAVNAMGQATFGSAGDEVAGVLLDYLTRETGEGPGVRSVIGRTLGRIYYNDEGGLARAEEAMLQLTRDGGGDAPVVTLLGAIMGLESMARRRASFGMSEETVVRLRELATLGRAAELADLENPEDGDETDEVVAAAPGITDPLRFGDPAHVRRVTIMALSAIGEVSLDVFRASMSDPDPEVRRLAVSVIGRSPTEDGIVELLLEALADSAPRVRVEAVRALAVHAEGVRECPMLFGASDDDDLHVALAALDLLQQTCENRARQDELLGGLAAGLTTAGPMEWHRGAHALVAFATVDPEAAAPLVAPAAVNPNPFIRAYAARAAARMGDIGRLETLAADESPNVRTSAVQALVGLRGHDADDVLIAQLNQDDPQLLLITAQLLEGTPNAAPALGPLIAAFERISIEQRETARDPRMAILERVAELGSGAQAAGLEPYLNDHDPVVAARVAEILTDWTGRRYAVAPAPLPRQALPSAEAIQQLVRTRVVLEMARGGEIEIRLLAQEAPAHAARFSILAGLGAFDGLTFHRVASNFVIQGGSPDANEYSGDAAYTRDELGTVSHWRGTVGASTRGRDTGDGQIFINVVDNLRLDHDYTVFGEVVRGMDVVDLVAEGDVIVRARVVAEPVAPGQ